MTNQDEHPLTSKAWHPTWRVNKPNSTDDVVSLITYYILEENFLLP